MESSLAAILALGFVLGLKHATDADHVVAVTTFVSREKSLLRSCWIGALLGRRSHSFAGRWLEASSFFSKSTYPDRLRDRLEFAVAVMLVVLGARVLYKTWKERLQFHRHPHSHAPGTVPTSTGIFTRTERCTNTRAGCTSACALCSSGWFTERRVPAH